jgi:hypothetical protein
VAVVVKESEGFCTPGREVGGLQIFFLFLPG